MKTTKIAVLLGIHLIAASISPSFVSSPEKLRWLATYIFGFTGALLLRQFVLWNRARSAAKNTPDVQL